MSCFLRFFIWVTHSMHKYWHYELMKIVFDYTSVERTSCGNSYVAELSMEPILATGCLISGSNSLTWESFAGEGWPFSFKLGLFFSCTKVHTLFSPVKTPNNVNTVKAIFYHCFMHCPSDAGISQCDSIN